MSVSAVCCCVTQQLKHLQHKITTILSVSPCFVSGICGLTGTVYFSSVLSGVWTKMPQKVGCSWNDPNWGHILSLTFIWISHSSLCHDLGSEMMGWLGWLPSSYIRHYNWDGWTSRTSQIHPPSHLSSPSLTLSSLLILLPVLPCCMIISR